MRKYLLMLTVLLFIAACGNNESENESVEADAEITEDAVTESEGETNEELDEFIEENDVQLDEDGFFVETTDPLEAGNKNNGIVAFSNENGEYFIVKEWYVNEDTDEDGFNTVDFNGYEVRYAITLIENVEEEDVIGVFAETYNGTDYDIQFNQSFTFVTDTKDQAELEHGITNNKPDTKVKFFNYATLEYGTPETLTVEIAPPFRDEGFENYDEDEFGDPIELEFTKE